MTFCTGFMVHDAGYRMQCRAEDAEYSIQGVQDAGYRIQGTGCRIRGTGFRMQGPGCVANDLCTDLYPPLTFDESMKIVGGSRFKDNVSWE